MLVRQIGTHIYLFFSCCLHIQDKLILVCISYALTQTHDLHIDAKQILANFTHN